MKSITYTFAFLAVLTLGGCGDDSLDSGGLSGSIPDTPAGLADSYVDHLDGVADAIESVDDEESARKAARSIAELNQQMEAIVKSTEGMGDMERGMAFANRAQDLMKVQQRIAIGVQNLSSNPELMQIVGEEIGNMPNMQ